ncbi:MAG: DUF2892 domain-containing protein [Chloroflexota bacterium]|nr:DUF2892 domain-containing protein [Chloroflexota bacterium]MDE3103011.1 DUF2892 domain-containing protein [Chloroflexota bacterium]
MIPNMGKIDRIARVVVGVGAAVASFLVGPLTAGGAVLDVVTVLMLVTAIVGFCPLYALFGLRTNARYR